MEYTIKDMYEQGDVLRIIVEHDYGTDNIGLGLHAKSLDPQTDEPRYKSELARLLQKKYGDQSRKKKHIKTEIGKKYTVEGINPGINKKK